MFEAGLLSREAAVEGLSEFTGITDIESEMEKIAKDAEVATQQEVTKRAAGKTMQDDVKDEGFNVKKMGKTNGHADAAIARLLGTG